MNIYNVFVATTICSSNVDAVCASSLPGGNSSSSLASGSEIQTILSIVFMIIGSLAVLFMILSGVRYIVSGGDPQKVAKAKDGILYALVGIVVSVSAEAIVAFVLGSLK